MPAISLFQFKKELKVLAELPVLSNHDMLPWFYDIIEPLGGSGIEIHKSIKVLSKCLEFFDIRYPSGTPLFFLEKRSFTAFAHMLKVKHADSIEFFRTTNACMRSINDTLVPTFAELSNVLLQEDLDDAHVRGKYVDIIITLITLAYSESLPLAKVPDLTAFTHVPAMDITYDIVHSLDAIPFILRMEEEEHFLYINAKTNRSVRLDKDVAFTVGYLIAILKTYTPTERFADLAFYGIGGQDAWAIIDKTNRETL